MKLAAAGKIEGYESYNKKWLRDRVATLEKLIEDHGYYPYRAEPGELEAREAAGSLDQE